MQLTQQIWRRLKNEGSQGMISIQEQYLSAATMICTCVSNAALQSLQFAQATLYTAITNILLLIAHCIGSEEITQSSQEVELNPWGEGEGGFSVNTALPGNFGVCLVTTKLNSANISYSYMKSRRDALQLNCNYTNCSQLEQDDC